MLIKTRRAVLLLALFFAGFCLEWRISPPPGVARAQGDLKAETTTPIIQDFPRIITYLDVWDSQGFVHGIAAEDLRILENGQPIQAAEFRELRPGVQFVVVLNPGPSFAIRNSLGKSRFDLVVSAVEKWVQSRQGSTLDDLSLVLAGGSEATHVSAPTDILAPLETYEFDAEATNPNLDILVRGLEIASDSMPRPGMERAVLAITALPQGDLSQGLQNISSLAAQGDIQLFIWLVASPEVFGTPVADLLAELAAGTGGALTTFSGDEILPELEDYLDPLRSIYMLAYDSPNISGFDHELVVEVQHDGQTAVTLPQSFQYDLQPPDLAFISPPAEIIREYPAGASNSGWKNPDAAELTPLEVPLQVLIHFPDGHSRSIVKTRFYVDGVLTAERQEDPFDLFTWELGEYTTTGQHSIQVEAVDNLGLQGASIVMPVQVTVEQPKLNRLASILPRWPILLGLATLLVAAVLLLFLILGGRIVPQAVTAHKTARHVSGPESQTELVKVESTPRPLSNWVNKLHWPQRRLSPNAYAFLVHQAEFEDSSPQNPIPITTGEVTLGRDVNLATLLLDDPSVDGLHARLVRLDDGSFRLADEGSVAGTWINYTPVSREGELVEHGDIIHIGAVNFRFLQRDPARLRKPVIISEE